ncbi:MAG: HYR domain-containing protein [Phaeodactylibacter sp.]|nr:HYR domain-containing protein [Phaeodactylibacter sp.]MCB9276646.1 HYR domain-containing protein [Lewinellaceae bacterium]
MKHLTNIYRENRKVAPERSALNRMFQLAFFVLLNILSFNQLSAQCSLACNGGDPNNPLPAYVDSDCAVTLDKDNLLEVPGLCPGDKAITVRDTMNNVIITGTNTVIFDAEPYYGQVLSVTIANEDPAVFCNSYITLVDTLAPSIDCVADTISCLADTSVASLGYPLVFDNCPDNILLTHSDTVYLYGCDSTDFRALVERTWIAEDFSGNRDTCVQPILVRRPQLQDIVFPADTVLACDGSAPDISVTGRPNLYGLSVLNGNGCSLLITSEDDTVSTCGNIEYAILRNWRVLETCSGLSVEHEQLIEVVDTVAPQIICPAPVTVGTIDSYCHATVNLPSPTVVDNCDPEASFFLSTSYGAVGTGPHLFVPVGTHTLQYTAIDNCGNTRICTTTLNVVDDEAPAAVCDEYTAVSVPTGGIALVSAHIFDEGSNDNCASTLYFKVKRATPGGCGQVNGDDSPLTGYQEWLDDKVAFCCEEAGSSVDVILHVYEINPGNGPVDPTRELPGGNLHGHFNACTVHVEVQDKLAPVLMCPYNQAISCTTDYSDLSIFGSPIVTDNCGYTLDSLAAVDINGCGAGTITRTFRAMDPSGNIGSCVQTITIESAPLAMPDIAWPADYTLTVCGGSADPNDFPDGYNFPEIINNPCTDVGITYEDDLFNISFPACYKILRRWTVIDWCNYDPEHPENGGRFTDVQVIKVEDNDAPVLTCPSNIVAPVSANCTSANVTLSPVTALDCNPSVLITNNSPYANSNGPNASGSYPLGTTIVKYTASDRCGNLSTCQVSVTVSDQSNPSPVCIVGLSVNLQLNNGDGLAMLNATAFDGGSSDNCTSNDELEFTIREVGTGTPGVRPTTTMLSFDCSDRGNHAIEFWALDEAGNSAYCVTVVAVQDNNNICPQQVSGMIAGDIVTEEGEYVEDVMVQVSSNNSLMAYTGNNGFFEILNIPYGNDYSILPQRNTDQLNGVSTLDLVLISKHILGVQSLGSPYKMIAADVNKSGGISTLDLITLRKMILGVETAFPNGNKAWRFVASNYNFPDPSNPFATAFPEILNINDFTQSELEANFIAIKVGDVDNSATPNSFIGVEQRVTRGELALQLQDQAAKAGDRITIPVTAEGLNEILGYQFTFGFDTDALEFVELQAGALPNIGPDNFNLQSVAEGWASTSWNAMAVKAAAGNVELFRISFRAKRTLPSLLGLLNIVTGPTAAEAYKEEGSLLDVNLHFNTAVAESKPGFELYQNRPNPFDAETVVGFRLPEAGSAKLTVFSLAGQAIYTQSAYYEAGYHEIHLNKGMLPVSGLLYYQLETADYAATRKMIMME